MHTKCIYSSNSEIIKGIKIYKPNNWLFLHFNKLLKMISTDYITKIFEQFNNLNVMIIGDVMLDSYIWGKVNRVSPEAPVPIVEVDKRENRLGGAANVALNLKALGATPFLCSVIGNDDRSEDFIELLKIDNMPTDGLITSNSRKTTTKFRVIGNNHQLLRVDEETTVPLEQEESLKLWNGIEKLLTNNSIDAIIFQDYDKGIIDVELIKKVTEKANKLNIPVIVDPKKKNFLNYQNVTLFKPNIKELKEGLDTDFDVSNDVELELAVSKLQDKLNAQILLNTLSERGVFVSWRMESGYESMLIRAHLRNIADVSGAGDTVVSVAALCLALKVDVPVMAAISNLAGGLVCEEVGVVSIDKLKLIKEVNQLLAKQ